MTPNTSNDIKSVAKPILKIKADQENSADIIVPVMDSEVNVSRQSAKTTDPLPQADKEVKYQARDGVKTHIRVCQGRVCGPTNKYTMRRLLSDLSTSEGKVKQGILVEQCSCMGLCKQAANVKVNRGKSEDIFHHMTPVMMAKRLQKWRRG